MSRTGAAGGQLRIYLLGRFEVRAGQRLVIDHDWARHRASALLKRLALTPGRRLQREQLIDALWPEIRPSAAANNLYKNLHHLRTAFTAAGVTPPVHIRAGTVALWPRVWVDVEAFRNAARAARSSRTNPKLYDQALQIYAGDLLPDDIYDDETNLIREELKSLRLRLLVELSEVCERSGNCQEALSLLEQAAQADPVREEPRRALIRLYTSSGRRTEAIRQYQACRDILQRELGVAPSEETEALYRRIVEGGVEQPPPAVAGPALAPAAQPRVRYTATADGVKIAYWTLGQGPPLVVMPFGPHSHVQIEWQIPAWRAFYEAMAQDRMLVRYDGRGTGLSDRSAKVSSIEDAVSDLESVVDRLGLREFALFGPFHCGPAAIAYAARRPKRVSHLLLWCICANGAGFTRELMQRDWGVYCNTNVSCSFLCDTCFDAQADCELYGITYSLYHGGQSGTEPAVEFGRYMRESASRSAVSALVDAIGGFDVAPLLPRVRCPTLVLHRRGIPWLDPDSARRLAAGVPNGRLVLFEGDARMPFLNNGPEVMHAVHGFLGT